ncbi:MAG TPA: hypothetical protein VK889_03300 [Solirubrobacterales bacterium]|nr:hypothetical protein [Solirubrobacterales bacterium]
MTSKLALVVALAALALPGTAAANLPARLIGISPQNAANAKDYRLMREAGIVNARLPMAWSSIQRDNRAAVKPDWTAFDHDVRLAAENGIQIMPFLWGTPDWVAGDIADMPIRNGWERWAWTRFLQDAVRRYGPGGGFWRGEEELPYLPIRRWEIWNEQNIISFANDPSPARFGALIRLSGRVIKREDPRAEVVVGGFFGVPLQIPPNIATGDFLNRMYRVRGVKRFFDGVALHPYVGEATAMRAQILNMRRIMRAHGDAATPLYVTEIGWGSDPGPTRWERGLRGQATQLSRSFAMLSANRRRWRIGGVWWFSWADEPNTCQFCSSAGLLTGSREAKPAWYRFVAWTGGDPEAVPRAQFGAAE